MSNTEALILYTGYLIPPDEMYVTLFDKKILKFRNADISDTGDLGLAGYDG